MYPTEWILNDSATVSGIGHANDRPFCVSSKSQGGSILIEDPQTKCIADRCSLSAISEHECMYTFFQIALIPKVLQYM